MTDGDMPAMYYATRLRPGALWDPGKPAREQVHWDDHARFMDSLFDAGMVVLGGPFSDRSGSLVILEADSADQVRELFRDDPWTVHDVLVVDEVKEWAIFLDGRRRSDS